MTQLVVNLPQDLATSPPDEDELEEVDDDSDVPELRSRESLPCSAKGKIS